MTADKCQKGNEAGPPSLSKPINDSPFQRFLVLAGIKITRCFQKRSSPIFLLAPTICVKSGTFRDLAEASTIQFIAEHTSIPVPKVYCAFRRKGKTYIVMEKIKGQVLAKVWEDLSDQSQERILLQLRHLIEEMRALPAPTDQVANVDGGSLWDCRLPSGLERFGPFKDIREFHRHLRSGIDKAPPENPEIGDMIKLQEKEWGSPTFTHGNISSLNILIRGEEVVAIIDWETAGFFPRYWEYTTARQVYPLDSFWAQCVDRFLDSWPEALEMEKVRQRWWGDI